MHSRIKVECQNLKSEFDHELRHQTLTQTETINALRQQIDDLGAQLQQQQVATHPVLPEATPFQDATTPHHPYIITAKTFHQQMVAWLKSWMF